MKTRPLGNTTLEVSEICLGTMTWGSQNTQEQAFEQMNYALSKEVNFWDTAELYPVPPAADTVHRTEEIIGNYFDIHKNRDKVILATKVTGMGIPHIRSGTGITPQSIDTALEGSLRRLKTDYIDLYQLHWPNRQTYHFGNLKPNYTAVNSTQARDEHLAILEQLQKHIKAGKIRHIGLSDDTAWGTMTYAELSRTHNLPKMVSLQNEYSLLNRKFEQELQEIALFEKIGLLAWSPLACGAISGKYLDGQCPKGSRKDYQKGRNSFRDTPASDSAIRAYIALAQSYNLDVCQMALAYLLTKPFMTAVIIGATTMAQLETNIAAADITLPQEVISKIDMIYRNHAFCF